MENIQLTGFTVEYPGRIAFAYNPYGISIYGDTTKPIDVKITDTLSNKSYSESRYVYNGKCYFDFSPYFQAMFDPTEANRIDYNQPANSSLCRAFEIEINCPRIPGDVGGTYSTAITVDVIWGAMEVGETFNGNRELTWFRNYPFTIGVYTAGATELRTQADGRDTAPIHIPSQGIWNVPVTLPANRNVIYYLPEKILEQSVWDMTFDYTFHKASNKPSLVTCVVDDSDCGIYLRWINRHGFHCYWLFARGEESHKIKNEGEFLRNNMASPQFVGGYHGGTGRKQLKSKENTIDIAAPLVNQKTYDYLSDLLVSPIVDLYCGRSPEDIPQWLGVNIEADNVRKSSKPLQNFVATLILPETRVPGL